MNRALKLAWLWGPWAGWCGLIYYFSSFPDLGTGWGVYDFILRKIAHVVEYAILCALSWRALAGSRPSSMKQLFWFSVVFSVAYAASDEFHQSFVPGRGPAATDVLIDSVGVFLAAWWQYRHRTDLFAWSVIMGRKLMPCLLVMALFPLSGCGTAGFANARWDEHKGRYEEAVAGYLKTADAHANGFWKPSALFRAGVIASRKLSDDLSARQILQRLLDQYGNDGDWGPKTEWALLNAPNYFPLVSGGQWTEGDSDTGGRNARVDMVGKAADGDPTAVLMVRHYYAGQKLIEELSTNRTYRKRALELREYSIPGKEQYTVILKYPFERGARWISKRANAHLVYMIEGLATVKVRAGEFRDCLKVREYASGNESSWKVDYYAPGVGKVLTSLATASGEKRNTELISYQLSGKEEKYIPVRDKSKKGLWKRLKSAFRGKKGKK